MKRLIFLAIIAFAAWYGYKHYDQVMHPQPRHEAVIRNDTGNTIVRMRLTVGGHTYVKEELPTGQTATFPFTVDHDSQFDLVWEFDTNTSVGHWTGGLVAPGPLVARHSMTIRGDGGVIFGSSAL
jgi:hypothetical protein